MRVLVVNTGSSSLKLRVLDEDDGVAAALDVERWDGAADLDPVRGFLDRTGDVAVAGHRVVHGGTDLTAPALVTQEVEAAIEALTPLAPLHQPRGLAGIRALRALRPDLPSVACFDTAFHATMPAAAATYALPGEWRRRWPVRRFGFHGLSHAAAVRRATDLAARRDGAPRPVRVVTCHLGAGASLCAALDGRSVDTTMGFTPLDGLVMATRAGSVDPGLVLWLQREQGLSADEVHDGLEHRSGLAGLAGGSGDARDVLAARRRNEPDAVLAFDVYVHRLRRELGAMLAVLGGADVVVFTGGVGEHAPEVRAAALAPFAFAGVALDEDANRGASGDAEIGRSDAAVRVLVLTAREDVEIARGARVALAAGRSR